MPGDEYASTIRGGLKLKGSKPSGVTKKKKKPKPTSTNDSAEEGKKSALQKALEEEDAATSSNKDMIKGGDGEELDAAELRELDPRGDDGKTASERQYEEMRRKRVSHSYYPFHYLNGMKLI
jgi:protein FAM32A